MDKARTTTPAVRPALRRAAPVGDLARLGSESETERRVRAITPWVVSIMLHIGVIAIAIAVTYTMVQLRETPDPVLVIADFHALAHDPVRPLGEASGMPLPVGEEALPDPLEHPLADALAPQDDPVLALAPPTGGAAAAPATPIPVQVPATFAGLRASNAQKVVYVVDASGSMIGALPVVIDELARSLRSMVPQQEFAIIFFQRNQSLAVPPRDRLTPARPAEQAKAIRWIRDNVIPNGRSNPLKAIEDALRLRPDVVFVLSNNITGSGQFEIEQSRLLELLDHLNPVDPMSGQRRTQIQCVQFLDDDPLQTLRRIAERHGGPDGYRFISRADLPGATP
ncbi:MAG: hypothetical protein KDA22_02770 [Phycisphaerales bacterium]|nr:hypothetical protein [Phycisphaerales bacterium]